MQAFASIPVLHEGRTIAVLNLASHIVQEFPPQARNMIEGIAAQIGSVIARFKVETDLNKSRESPAKRIASRRHAGRLVSQAPADRIL